MSGIIERLHMWTGKIMKDRLLKRWGMVRQCPWCRQCIENMNGDHKMRDAEHCEIFLTFTCSVCGGESHWEFAPVPLPRGLGCPPKPMQWALDADRETRLILGLIAKSDQ